MANIAGPNILSATRYEGRSIRIQYSAGASGYTVIAADVRELTGSWAQGNQMTLLNGLIFVAGRAGVPLDPKKSYQVKLRAAHESGLPVAESSVSTVGPWEVPAPTLLSVTRPFPTQAALTYEGAPVGEGAVLYVERRTTPSGTWAQVTSFTPKASGAGTYTIQLPSGAASYEVRIFAGQYGVSSGKSSPRSVNAWETPTPTLTAVTRTGETTASVQYSGASTAGRLYVRRRSQANAQTTVSFDPSSSSGTYTLTGLSGKDSYDVWLYTVQSGVTSGVSATRSLEAWFTVPAGVTDLAAARRPDGTVDLTWSGVSTTRAPYRGQRVYRADGELGQLRLLAAGAITGTRRSFYDSSAEPQVGYRYMVVPFNDAGEATSRQVENSPASTNAPSSPGSVTATYVSDTSADVEWPDSSTPGKEVTSYEIRRWLLGAWSTVKTVPGTQLSWRDPGLAANGRYRWQVRASNAAGPAVAYSPGSNEIVTTPAGASSVSAARSGPDVSVTWVAPSGTIAESWDVSHTVNPNPATAPEDQWFPMSVGTLAGTARKWVHKVAAGGVPHTYRVRPTVAGGPTAPWRLSSTVSPFATPNAPTLGAVAGRDAADGIRLSWTHSPTDGTAQVSAVVKYRPAGGVWVTVNITGDETFYTIPAGTLQNGVTVEWQVTTKGAAPNSSPAATGSFQTRPRPAVAIIAPTAGVVSSSVVTLAWSAVSQSSWTARLLNVDGRVVDTRSGGSAARSTTFDGLMDRGTYTIQLVVNDGVQDSLAATVTITVALARPAAPTLTAVPDPVKGSVALETVAVQGLRLRRINYSPSGLDFWYPEGQGSRVLVSSGGVLVEALAVSGSQFLESAGVTGEATFPPGWVYRHGMNVSHSMAGQQAILSAYSETAVVALPEAPARMATISQTLAGTPGDAQLAAEPVGGGATTTEGVFYMSSPYIVGGPTLADIEGGEFFDGDTRRDGYVYGWNPDGSAYEAVPTSDPAEADIQVAPTARVEILMDRGKGWERVGDVNDDGRLEDLLPPLCTQFRYMARAWTAEDAYTDSAPVEVHVHSRDTHINFGPGWTGHVTGGARDLQGTGGGRDGETVLYAGHRQGTRYQSETRQPRKITVSVQLLRGTGVSSWEDWIDALATLGNVTYRDPSGIVLEGMAELAGWVPEDMFKQSVSFVVSEAGGV